MLTFSNTSAGGTAVLPRSEAAYVNAASGGVFLWCATARDLTTGADLGTVSAEPTRTATTCYMRGLSEHLRIQTSTGLPWFHRRICFTYKGIDPFQRQFPNEVATPLYIETSSGYSRLMFNSVINSTPTYLSNLQGILFKGVEGVDWVDYLIAPVDTRRITVKFDKMWTYRSGNANGMVKASKLWHPMNKNLVYSDDEGAGNMTTSHYSVDSKAGMGDYYVIDFFRGGTGGSTSDLLRIDINASLYWHEK